MPSNVERKLAAIMFTDIAGYTSQMSKDEDRAFALIQKKRKLLLPLVEQYEGKLIKEIGDGTLTRYFSVDNAIKCATDFQSRVDIDLNVRAGIHTGEVILDKEDVFGDVVNVASRLESIALPGSVLVSKETIDRLLESQKKREQNKFIMPVAKKKKVSSQMLKNLIMRKMNRNKPTNS